MMNVNNMEIIANEAVASGFFKKEEVEEPDFDANKYLNKPMINLFEDED